MTTRDLAGRLTAIAVLIPLLGLLALIGRAEYAVRHGPTWVIAIEGYDPRDLLHGHYLRYRYAFSFQGEDTCGTPSSLDPACCLCLTRTSADGRNPAVRQVWCSEADDVCDGVLRVEDVQPQQRYYVPEDRALELEEALRTRGAALELTIGPDGRPAVRDLLLEGRPWREVLGE